MYVKGCVYEWVSMSVYANVRTCVKGCEYEYVDMSVCEGINLRV